MARGTPINWEKVIRDLVDLLGVNTPQTTRREHVAKAIDMKMWQIDPLAAQLRAIGALEIVATPGGFHEIGGRKYPVRASTWTVMFSADEILAAGKRRGIKWGQPERKAPKITAKNLNEVFPPVAPRGQEVVKPVENQSDSPFAVLRALKRDEAAALIESARQYAEKRVFINEEIARFAAHGLTFDPAVVGLPVDERLEAVSPLADYVSRLQRENERLQSYANQKTRDETEYSELQRRITRQDEQLAALGRAREQEHQEAVHLANQSSGKEATYKQKIAALEQENHDLRNAIARTNGPATAVITDAAQGGRGF